MTTQSEDWLDKILRRYITSYYEASADDSYTQLKTNDERAKIAILNKIEEEKTEAYKKGYIDGSIEILNKEGTK